MPRQKELLIAKPVLSATGAARSSLPTTLTQKSGPRIRAICLLLFGIYFFAWLLGNLAEGELAAEFATPLQYGGPMTAIVASFLVYFATLRFASNPERVVKIGLVYEVVIAWSMPIGTYWTTFRQVPVEAINGDLVGFSGVGLWMVLFTLLVPARPRQALVALTLSAAATPVTVAYLIAIGDMPPLGAVDFVLAFVVQYVLLVGVALFAATQIYSLGRDVKRAQALGSYHLLEKIGEGGMGEVWRAKHRLLARPAAIKLIRTDALGADSMHLQSAIARFEREAHVTSSLQSPHTVSLYDFGLSEDNRLYYVMELLEGIDLETMVKRFGPLQWERVVYILRQAVHSLSEAHRSGLIHRDIKPANLFLCKRAFEHDFLKILDFGLVKHQSRVDESAATNLTAAGTITGTPNYIPPEIALGTPEPDGRADLYSLGCVAFWLLTGRRVFQGDTPMAVIAKHISQPPDTPSACTELPIPEALDALVLALLAKDPKDRLDDALALGERLKVLEGDSAWTAKMAEDWWRRNRPETEGSTALENTFAQTPLEG